MLSDIESQEIGREIAHAEDPAAALIEALLIVQRHRGWVDDDALRAVAARVNLSAEAAESIATFYSLIYRRPVGRHVIHICDSITCWIVGYENLRDHLIAKLSIPLGGTTADGRFTLLTIPCLGICEQAPAMRIDDDTHVHLTPERIDEILERYV